jgi:hypothetical protein
MLSPLSFSEKLVRRGKKLKLPLYLINYAPHHEDIWGEWRYSFTILVFGTIWR